MDTKGGQRAEDRRQRMDSERVEGGGWRVEGGRVEGGGWRAERTQVLDHVGLVGPRSQVEPACKHTRSQGARGHVEGGGEQAGAEGNRRGAGKRAEEVLDHVGLRWPRQPDGACTGTSEVAGSQGALCGQRAEGKGRGAEGGGWRGEGIGQGVEGGGHRKGMLWEENFCTEENMRTWESGAVQPKGRAGPREGGGRVMNTKKQRRF